MAGSGTAEMIVEEADRLFYEQGFEHTSFADIAAAVKISRGNFYHHFKTKDDILDAVIALRLKRTQTLLADWERETHSPRERIGKFVDILIMNQAKIENYGCPVGTMCTELAKLDHAARDDANGIFDLFARWLASQFSSLGCGEEANSLALHLLGRSQGVATLANAFRDGDFIRREVAAMDDWVDSATAAARTNKTASPMEGN